MRIVITGSGGQLGRALRSELSAHDIAPLSRKELDIADLDRAREAVRRRAPDLVVNAAAFTDVDGAETAPHAAYEANARGPRNLALATAEARIPLLHVSTDYVFDGAGTRPYHEYDEPRPRSVYGASKLAGETAVRTHNPRHFVVRTSWLYHADGKNFPQTMLSLASREEVRVVSDQYGSPTYAPHLARAIGRLIETESFGTYHLAGSGQASWYELARTLYELLGIARPVVPVATADFPRPAERPRYAALTTIQSPRIVLPPWREGLAEFARAVGEKPPPSRRAGDSGRRE